MKACAVQPCYRATPRALCIAAAYPKRPDNTRGIHQLGVTVSRALGDRIFSLSMRRLGLRQELLSRCGKILHNNYDAEITLPNQILARCDSGRLYRPMLADTK
jgi:hypothetical protein